MARYARLKILLALGPGKKPVPRELIEELKKSIENDRNFHQGETDFPVWEGHKLHGKESG